MSRVPSLSSPFLLGFDEIERVLDRVAKGADGYPPYNIERLPRDGQNPERLRITLAVAAPPALSIWARLASSRSDASRTVASACCAWVESWPT